MEYQESVKKYSYRELQAIAKKLGLPGNLKHHLLFEVIKARECGNENVVQKILTEQKFERARRKSEKLEGKDAGYKHLNLFQDNKRGPRPKLLIQEPQKPQQFQHQEAPKPPKKEYSRADSYLRSLLALPHHSIRELMMKNHQESLLRAKKMREAALGIPAYQVDNAGAHCSTQVITEYQNPYNADDTFKYTTNYSNDGNARITEIENLQSTDCNALQPRCEIQDSFMQFYPSYVTTTTTTNENIISSFIPDNQPQPEYSYIYPSNQIEYTPYYQENSYSHDYLKVDNNNVQCIENAPMYKTEQNMSPPNSDTMSASEPEYEQTYYSNQNEIRYVYPVPNQVENVRNEMQIAFPTQYNYQINDNQLMINQPQENQIVYESEVQNCTLELQQHNDISPNPINDLSNNKDLMYEEISSEEKYLDLAQEIEITTYTSDKDEGVSTDIRLLNVIDHQEYQEWSYKYTAPDSTLNYVHGITHASYFQLT